MRLARGAALAAILLSGASAGAALADDTRLQPDFTFRRVAAPPSGTPPRITVQIDPEAPSAIRPGNSAYGEAEAVPLAAAPGAAMPQMPPASGAEWFWALVPPELGMGAAERVNAALAVLASPPEGEGVTTPRLATLQAIAEAHGRDILAATIGTEVSPALVLAVIAVESAGNAGAESHAGAAGLMQLMPDTATRFGVADRLDALESIRGGTAYLDWLLGHFQGDAVLALAGYNAGEGSVRDNGGVPPYAETRAYVPKVLAAWRLARGLCQTPPELLSDGCVFTVNNL
ncbi:lytic transglycosylase domain-containing protein [Pseudoroseicyclus tamaricis]|uniref:Lytic transglycosylase domain-containing protein n=1 Tax=Pseudoroseicyclus tamaricis TaxID=2705421 RepID=A0A6B2JV68_9RHOB|nr:lytic transglycosylase domain-containing protein [Pseudoroseicyclus tamaricis]NDV01785.1 lytic transglycosylase domain-containing protein [Pseudoroseicyclus tamaricis]